MGLENPLSIVRKEVYPQLVGRPDICSSGFLAVRYISLELVRHRTEAHMKRLISLSVLSLLVMMTGCRYISTPIQAGEFGYTMNGITVKAAKVTQTSSGYDMQWNADNKWMPVTGPTVVLSKRELGQLVTGPVDRVQGLKSHELTLLFVPREWTQMHLGTGGLQNTEFKCYSGFVWWNGPLGPMCLAKL
jgi:hypothetical protein